MKRNIESLVILGGGTAGWMAAAALSQVIGTKNCSITVVESETIGTVGVGEATIPHIAQFNKILGIDENQFVKDTGGSFKLGIEFVNWGALGDRYVHPFGQYGTDFNNLPFYHYWQKIYKDNRAMDLGEFSLNAKAGYHNKFMRGADIDNSPLANIVYAFHFDASLYAKYLREYSEARGAVRVEGVVSHVNLDQDNGNIASLVLENGSTVAADFFIDCSGFRGLLIEQTLKSGFEDWAEYLPCDSAYAVPTGRLDPLPSYTRATAREAGWQWRIPLQHRTGNGHVFSSNFISNQAAENILMENLNGKPLAEPKLLRFKMGKRKKMWNKNCVALGLASGFLEPLESTSIHLIQSGISKLLSLFPRKGDNTLEAEKFNEQMAQEYLGIRDFIIAHYKLTQRDDSEFWRYCRNMPIPDSLANKIELYKSSSRLFRENNELFGEASWLAIMHGQGVLSDSYSPLVDAVSMEELKAKFARIHEVINRCVEAMPSHAEFIAKNCKTSLDVM